MTNSLITNGSRSECASTALRFWLISGKMTGPGEIANRLLTIIAIVAVVAALRASYSVTMPVVVAMIVIAAIWPIKPWLDRVLPSTLSYVATVAILLSISLGFLSAIYFSSAQIVRAFAQNQQQFSEMYQILVNWAGQWGLQELGWQEGYKRLISFGQLILSNTYTLFVYLGFIVLIVILGLPEVPALRRKLSDTLGGADRRELIGTVDEIAGKIRQYLGLTALTSVITGVASTIWALIMGLDLALVWGVLNFLLNFIPTIGNIIGIIPPTIYAMIQFQSFSTTVVVFIGFAILQIAISNFLYPSLQGRSLSLSPVAIIIALAFWSWVWGIAGALIAVPLTAALVIVCEHFRSTEWISRLLSNPRSQ